MDGPLRKVTAKVDLKPGTAFARARPSSRPASPTKLSPVSLSPPSFRPKAKVNGTATVRKLLSSSSLSTSRAHNAPPPSVSRSASPLRSSRVHANGSEPGNSPKARITARPIGAVQTTSGSLEPRQRALTAASPKLKLPHPEDRPRSGSVIGLHHALSVSDFSAPSSPTLSHSSPPAEHPVIDIGRTDGSPALSAIRIKSKVTGLARSMPTNPGDPASPPYATTRPIHARARAPSVTTLSLNDPPSTFYPITTASPAANPHRYTPRRAPSPARAYPSPTLSSEPHPAKKSPLVPKVDPASVPLPPHSPPISAVSLSSKSSVSLHSDHTADLRIPPIPSHVRSHTDRVGLTSPFLPQADVVLQRRRDRSRSKERSPHNAAPQGDSEPESEGSERQLRAEAKTNRKIADLEITNRSLLAINASLETTKNRQAKEIRDLRRKLRESRLILPPQTYKAVQSITLEEDEDEDDSGVEEGPDEAFQRIRTMIDGLIESGKRALETQLGDFRAGLAAKVLNADELRSWRDSGQHASSYMDKYDANDETIHSHPSPAILAMPDSDSTSSADSDKELAADSVRSPALPPITITHSS